MKGKKPMTRDQAAEYIARLSYEEKLKLYELLKVLEQKRQLDASRPA